MLNKVPFIDHRQTFYELAAIQIVPLGMPAILAGNLLTKQFGSGIAVGSIIIANLLIWLIAILIISMSFKTRSNAVQNVNNYLGNQAANIKRFLLIIAFIFWFSFQIQSTLPLLENYFTHLTFLGGAIACITAILSMGGIRLIKWSCVISFPFVFLYYIYAISSSSPSAVSTIGISFNAILTSVLVFLPFVVNSPTFFRHSRSRADSYLALTFMTILISFFQISTVWINFSNLENYFTLLFMLWIMISTNLLSIYLASMSFDGLSVQFQGAKVYLTLGILGTIAYFLIPVSSTSTFILNLMNSYIASQGIVLCIAFFIYSLVGYKLPSQPKRINIFCWLMGCLISTILSFLYDTNSNTPLLSGIGTSVVCFFIILFLKENLWAIRKLREKR